MSNQAIAADSAEKTSTIMMGQLIDDMMMQRKELMDEVLLERRKDRRHKNIRFALIFTGVLITVLTYLYLFFLLGGVGPSGAPSGPYAAIVQLKGPIADGKPANAVAINKALSQAFKDPRARGVVLYVNSPGGSPVQSSIIYDRIVSLRAEYPREAYRDRCHRHARERRLFRCLGHGQDLCESLHDCRIHRRHQRRLWLFRRAQTCWYRTSRLHRRPQQGATGSVCTACR